MTQQPPAVPPVPKMSYLDTLPAELRLDIYRQYVGNRSCSVNVIVTAPCALKGNHSIKASNPTGDYRVNFTMSSSHASTSSSLISLLAVNKRIRNELGDFIARQPTTHIHLESANRICMSCGQWPDLKQAVPMPWRQLVDKVKLSQNLIMPSLASWPARAVPELVTNLRKITLPDVGWRMPPFEYRSKYTRFVLPPPTISPEHIESEYRKYIEFRLQSTVNAIKWRLGSRVSEQHPLLEWEQTNEIGLASILDAKDCNSGCSKDRCATNGGMLYVGPVAVSHVFSSPLL